MDTIFKDNLDKPAKAKEVLDQHLTHLGAQAYVDVPLGCRVFPVIEDGVTIGLEYQINIFKTDAGQKADAAFRVLFKEGSENKEEVTEDKEEPAAKSKGKSIPNIKDLK